MLTYLDKLRPLLLLTFAITYLSGSLQQNQGLFLLTTLLLLVILLITVPLASVVNRRISLTLFILGSIFLYANNLPLSQWLLALGANAGLVAMFLALPLFSFPLQYDDYEPALRDYSRKYINTPLRFATFYAVLAFFLSSILNIGSYAIVHTLYEKVGDYKDQEMLLLSSMSRANMAPIFWSPSYVAVAVVISYTYVPWVQIIPQGIALSLLTLVIIWLSNILMLRKSNQIYSFQASAIDYPAVDTGKILKLILISLLLLGLVAIFNIYTSLNILVIIPIVAIIYPMLLALTQRKITSYQEQLNKYYHITLPNIRNEIVIFAAAGFFGKSLELTGVGKTATTFLHLEAMQQNGLFFLTITVLVSIMAAIGVHPVVTTSAVASAFTASALGVTPLTYTYILLAAYGFAVLVSPFSATSLVLAGLVGKSSWEVGPKINLRFAVFTALLFAVIFSLMP